ncbi:MAG: hypothetical protein NVSMB31_13970 [Vulcanimicrobiaceae bacterium]
MSFIQPAITPFFSTPTNLSEGFNIGQQRSISLVGYGDGTIYDLGRVTSFTASPKGTEVDSKTINRRGYVDHKYMREGWTGEIMFDRTNGNMDRLEALQERLFHAGGRQMYFTLVEKTVNDDGGLDEYTYERCEVHMTNGGTWRMDEKVEQTIAFRAAEKVQIL